MADPTSTMQRNALGRLVPVSVNGKPERPYAGLDRIRPSGHHAAPPCRWSRDYPLDGDKRSPSMREALERAGLRSGMTVSTHHHLRNGDLVAVELFAAAKELGLRDLVWFPSAAFPCHAALIPYLEDGTIQRIEGSMNGPLGRFTSEGRMRGTAVLRSHGGRIQALQDGEVKVDLAVIAAPSADVFGNANGLEGPSACGGLGYAFADARYADHVIVVTDYLVEFPCLPMQIEGNLVDQVLEMERIGIPERIVSGTLQVTRSPDRLLLAELTTRFCEAAGLIREGYSFQTGAGGTSLAIARNFQRIQTERNLRARFAVGGITRPLVEMHEAGLLGAIVDAQAFDLDAVRSTARNPRHAAVSVHHIYNPHSKGNYTAMMDIMVLGATEVDVHFNGNVVTHSDGLMLHGIGGWQNCLHARCTILPVPLVRNRIPVILDEVTTLCGPGELIDVIVTERGIAINPLRQDLLERVKGGGLPLRSIEELKREAERICGGAPRLPAREGRVVAAVKWVDGSVIDCVRRVG